MQGNAPQSGMYQENSKWPVIWFKPPYLVAVPAEFQKMMASLSVRISLPLDRTLDTHCQTMGVGKSEWVRQAIQYLLSMEQQWLEEHRRYK